MIWIDNVTALLIVYLYEDLYMQDSKILKTVHGALKKFSGRFISALLYLIIGVLLLKFPGAAIRTVCTGLGIVTLGYGLIRILSYVMQRREGFYSAVDIVLGAVLSAIGIVLLINPGFVVSIIPFCVGIIILVHSVSKIQQALELKAISYNKWWIMLIIALITLLMGVCIVVNPFGTIEITVRAIGIVLIVCGIVGIGDSSFTGAKVYKFEKSYASCQDEETGEIFEADVLDKDGKVISND